MFNSSGICFLEKQIEILFSNKAEYNKYKIKIKRIGHLFYQYQQKINEKEKNKKGDIIYINQVDNNSDNDGDNEQNNKKNSKKDSKFNNIKNKNNEPKYYKKGKKK